MLNATSVVLPEFVSVFVCCNPLYSGTETGRGRGQVSEPIRLCCMHMLTMNILTKEDSKVRIVLVFLFTFFIVQSQAGGKEVLKLCIVKRNREKRGYQPILRAEYISGLPRQNFESFSAVVRAVCNMDWTLGKHFLVPSPPI